MKTVDGREDPILIPSRFQLVVSSSLHVPANIMAPPAVTDVGGRVGKIRLEGKALPGNHRVSRKTYGVTVGAHPCITRKSHRTLSLSGAVQKVIVVQHPEGVKPLHLGVGSLLPVKPPEIHALILHGMMNLLEINLQEFRIRNIKVHRLFLFLVYPHGLRHLGITVLKSPHSVCRMDIQRGVHGPVVELLQKARRIREHFPVPGITCPPTSVLGVNIHQMPIHVNHRHRKRNPLPVKALHQLYVGFFRIFIISAPPVSKDKPGQHGGFAAQEIKIFQRLPVTEAVSKEINVLSRSFSGRYPSVLSKEQGLGVIHTGNALEYRHNPLVQLAGSVHGIQRPCGSF